MTTISTTCSKVGDCGSLSIIAFATAPYPSSQLSTISTNGGVRYPEPPSVIFIPIKLPVCSAKVSPTIAPKIAFPVAPSPPPPKMLTCIPEQFNGGPV